MGGLQILDFRLQIGGLSGSGALGFSGFRGSGIETQRTLRTTKAHKGGFFTTAAQRVTTFGFVLPAIYDLSSASEIPDERRSATSGRFTIYGSGQPPTANRQPQTPGGLP